MVIHALKHNDISILTHPGDKGPFDIKAIAEVCAETDTLMEINTWHGHLTEEEIKIAAGVEAVSYTHLWISSESMVNSTLPASISSSISCNVLIISRDSSPVIIPCFPSILAWAILPAISSL